LLLINSAASAQPPLDVFGDDPLPLMDDAPVPPSSDQEEELPPATSDSNAPQIDPEMSLDHLDDPLPPIPSRNPAGARAPVDARTPPGGLEAPRDDDVGDELLDDSNAELLPQETIRERYPDGRVRIERGVTQDDNENYVNHGPWRMWDEAGNLVVEGNYQLGKRDGKWSRWYQAEEAELFQGPPFSLFTAPFLSSAEFTDDELEGHWVITDQNEMKICDWAFESGRRQGESTWYYHTGRKMRVIQYRDGQISGELIEWDASGEQVTRVQYQDGRRLEKTTELYADGQKKVEGTVLQARLVMKEPDDWWNAKLATYTRQGKDQKHGEWSAWYPNGQMKFTGEYAYDEPSGEFTWWHENGQRSLQAFYRDGQKTGAWTWWHPNGQKSIQGEYLVDSPTGRWVWWHDTGKVAQRIDFSQAAETMVTGPPGLSESESIMLQRPQNRGAMRVKP
jgi:antitoxin component YwqK of YwqJK toxin-antitoxin module